MRNFIVGIVFLGSLFALGVVTLKVTELPFDLHLVKVGFDQTKGLKTGDEVRIYGFRVGSVDSIDYMGPQVGRPSEETRQRGKPILVTIALTRELILTRDTKFVVKSLGPLGGNYLDIVPGTGDIQALDNEFEGTASAELFDELGDFIRENRDTISDALSQIKEAVRAINEREGALGLLIKDPDVRDRLSSFVKNLDIISKQITEGKGTVGKLVMESSLHDDLGAITRAIREGRGTLGKLVMQSTLHDDLQSFASRADRILYGAEQGTGTVGMLLKDEGLARDLKTGMYELRGAVAKVNQGEGTLGQLINNREGWDRFVFILRQVQEAVEDFREQAPISTFVNAIFAGF